MNKVYIYYLLLNSEINYMCVLDDCNQNGNLRVKIWGSTHFKYTILTININKNNLLILADCASLTVLF